MQKAITEYEEMSKHLADPLLTHDYGPERETRMATATTTGGGSTGLLLLRDREAGDSPLHERRW